MSDGTFSLNALVCYLWICPHLSISHMTPSNQSRIWWREHSDDLQIIQRFVVKSLVNDSFWNHFEGPRDTIKTFRNEIFRICRCSSKSRSKLQFDWTDNTGISILLQTFFSFFPPLKAVYVEIFLFLLAD